MKKWIKEYCVGCGLCEVYGKGQCKCDNKGYIHPYTGDESWLQSVCPACGQQQKGMDFGNIWGRTESVYYGWSKDEKLRHVASSGGVLTEIAGWMLEKQYVDAVLHTCADPDDLTKTICCISVNRAELVSRCGSRYAISHPLKGMAMIDTRKKYVFIGKPCDITALYNYMENDKKLKDSIVLILSFFCAGLPSKDAQNKLLGFLGCKKENATTLRYRGNGWPGYTVVIDNEGKEYRTDYNTSWGKILGRDVMKACRFCLDGIGEMADISCGDGWHLAKDKSPDFSEAEGRNIIFARTVLGKKLLDEVIINDKIEVEPVQIENLQYIQSYQMDRRATMFDKLMVLKLFGKPIPKYDLKSLWKFTKAVGLKKHIRVCLGTVKRILAGKI